MQIFPITISRFVDAAGRIVQPFIGYLQQFTIAPPAFAPITLTGSVFSYTAKEPGFVYIAGGTVSLVQLMRGTDTITVSGSLIPVAIEDTVKVTYTVAPTMKFIANYGQNTTS